MRVLGIESSCDETSAAVVEDGRRLLSVVTNSSMDLHAAYGGVVPEIAARSHIEAINLVIDQALRESQEARVKRQEGKNTGQRSTIKDQGGSADPWDDIDAIAVTYGAGLGGSLLIGVLAARTLAIIKHKPLYAINHVEGHLYANFITETPLPGYTLRENQPEFPMLGLIVSGGHSQLVFFRNHFDYTLLGQTQDDAIGEAFDKVAKILGLPYPGGPSVSQKALEGNPHAFDFPKAHMREVSPALSALRARRNEERRTENGEERPPSPFAVLRSYDFSFSGLKTAVLRLAQAEIGQDFTFPSKDVPERLSEAQKANIAASFQRVAIETIVDKAVLAFEEFQPKSFIIGGGVAASPELRRQLAARLPHVSDLKGQTGHAYPVAYTDPKLCTDNGAMIATLGCFKAMLGQPTADPYTLDIQPNLSM